MAEPRIDFTVDSKPLIKLKRNSSQIIPKLVKDKAWEGIAAIMVSQFKANLRKGNTAAGLRSFNKRFYRLEDVTISIRKKYKRAGARVHSSFRAKKSALTLTGDMIEAWDFAIKRFRHTFRIKFDIRNKEQRRKAVEHFRGSNILPSRKMYLSQKQFEQNHNKTI